MTVLVLNGSPRADGTVARLLRAELARLSTAPADTVIWHDVRDVRAAPCTGCMACRSCGQCVLPADGAHTVADEIRACDVLLVGMPVYWGNMRGAPCVIVAEVNVGFDYNEFYTKKNSGVNGQPSVVYRAHIPADYSDEITLELAGMGAVDGADGKIHEGTARITTALGIVRSVTVTAW